MSAPAAAPSCGPKSAIAACSVLTALCPVRRCKRKAPPVAAPHDYRRNIPRLAGKRVEQLTSVVDTARGITCRVICSHPRSCCHLDRSSRLDGHGVYPERQTLRTYALPLHRTLFSRDDRAGACPCLHFICHLRLDSVGRRHRRRKPAYLVGDGAGVGEVLIVSASFTNRLSR
jgi:hypothetical protein